MKKDNKRFIDLSDIKEDDLDKTSSFTDLMTRSERKMRKKQKELEQKENIEAENKDDIESMVEERKKSTKDLTIELEKAKEEYNNSLNKKSLEDEKEESISKTQILELTRQMKFNFNENKEENNKIKKRGISFLNIIGEINLLCIGYYIYLLVFTNYQEEQQNYLINGGLIVLLVLLFGISVVTNKKVSKFFNVINILAIIGFIVFNAYTLLN